MSIKEMADAIRTFPGVTRKNKIHEVVDLLPTDGFPQVYAAEGDTALEALPLRGEGEKKLLGLNGAPEVCWGLTFQ